ncbi:Twinfilin-1 [Saitozyma podzolica]|uniref:Twinfilin-1 n=1 Tax=Saitozyma podzolica TaxID=1890683 RepID=A0A427YSK9_9TREE|nr:Twinfilin-1 [Saitozyma podzolica]
MSAPSGIKVPPSLTSAFGSAQSNGDDVRALVFTIEGESFTHLTTVKPKSSYKDDMSLLPSTLPSPKTPASFAYRLDSKEMGKYEWMMITFVPDDAGVRAKMLQASSRAGLLKSLGANNFKHDWFATSLNDLTPSSLHAHLNHLASPPPLSASEAALAEVREAEAAEAKRAALDPETEARRRAVVTGLGGKMAWGDGVADAMTKVAERSDDGWVVCLEIPSNNTGGLSLLKSEATPCYTFYSFPTPPPPAPATPIVKPTPAPAASSRDTFQASEGGRRALTTSWAPKTSEPEENTEEQTTEDGAETKVKDLSLDETAETAEPKEESPTPAPEAQPAAPQQKVKGRVLFLYTCPSSSPIKFRMVYSSSVRSVQQDAKDKAGVEIVGKIETSDISDLTESHLKSSLPPSRPTHSSSLPTPTSGSFNSGPVNRGVFGAPAFSNPAAFGRPRPTPTARPVVSASQIPLPASTGPSTPVSATPSDEGDSKENIRKAFDAFGPRVNSGGGGGFARPRPAGRR